MEELAVFLSGILGGILLLLFIQFVVLRAYWKTFEYKGTIPTKPLPQPASHPVRT
jgi:hypothetical protein